MSRIYTGRGSLSLFYKNLAYIARKFGKGLGVSLALA